MPMDFPGKEKLLYIIFACKQGLMFDNFLKTLLAPFTYPLPLPHLQIK